MNQAIETIYRCRIDVTSPMKRGQFDVKKHGIACDRMSKFESEVERLCRAREIACESGNTQCLNDATFTLESKSKDELASTVAAINDLVRSTQGIQFND